MKNFNANGCFSFTICRRLKTSFSNYFYPAFPNISHFLDLKQLQRKLLILSLVSLFLTIDCILDLIALSISEGISLFSMEKGLELFHCIFLLIVDVIFYGFNKYFIEKFTISGFGSDVIILIIKSILMIFDIEMEIYLHKSVGLFLFDEGFKLFFFERLIQESYSYVSFQILSMICQCLYISLRILPFHSLPFKCISFFFIYVFWIILVVKSDPKESENSKKKISNNFSTTIKSKFTKTQKSKFSSANNCDSATSKEKLRENNGNNPDFDAYNIIDLFSANISDGCILFDENGQIKFRNEIAKEYFSETSEFTIHLKENASNVIGEDISIGKDHTINNCNFTIMMRKNSQEVVEDQNKLSINDLLEKLRLLKKESKCVNGHDLLQEKWMTLNERIEVEVNSTGKSFMLQDKNSLSSALVKMQKKIKKYPFLNKRWFELKLFIHAYQKNNDDILCLFIDKSSEQSIKSLLLINENKSKTISFVSHEIRTPLNCIINMLKIVESKLDEESYEKIIKPAENSASFLLNLVNDLLDMAQIEAGKFKLNYLEFDLKMLLSDIITLIKIQAEARKIELKLNCDPKLPELIKSDPNRIRQITINLLGNALKFTTKGAIIIRAKPVKGCDRLIKISVKDSGIGIKEEDQRKLFQAFGRLELGENETLNIQGVGLGLLISNTLSKNLGPKNYGVEGLQVKSKLGEGTKFSFILEDKNEENFRELEWDLQEKTVNDHMNILQNKFKTVFHFKRRSLDLKKEQNVGLLMQNKEKTIKKKSSSYVMVSNLSVDEFEPTENFKISTMTKSEHFGRIPKKSEKILKLKTRDNFLNQFFPNKKLMRRTQLISEILLTQHQNSKPSIDFLEVEEAVKSMGKQNMTKECECFDILICDDNDFNILALKYHLEEFHFTVDSCFSGEEAITKVKDLWKNGICCKNYQIIFMDIELPGKNGIETTVEILKFLIGKFDHQVIIGCTGHSSEKEKIECLTAGMETMMTKPISKGVLMTILAKCINLKGESLKTFTEKIALMGITEEKSYVITKNKLLNK